MTKINVTQNFRSVFGSTENMGIVWCLNSISVILQWPVTYPCFPGVLLSSNWYSILSKPLAAFPHNHCQNNRQLWERNESCCNDYHSILGKNIGQPGDWTRNLLFSSPQCHRLRYGAQQKTLEDKDKMLVSSIFSFSNNVFKNPIICGVIKPREYVV